MGSRPGVIVIRARVVTVGHSVESKEKQTAFEIGQKYRELATSLEGLSPDVPLYKVTEGNEPRFFTTYFAWDSAKATAQGNSFQKKLLILFGTAMESHDKSSGASHDGPTQRASALAALSSAFNPSPGGKTSSKPSVSGQGSQRAAAVAALSSVLTAEQKKALAESVAARSSTDSPKNENDPPVAEDPQEDQGVNETVDGVGSVSESNEEVSATKDESELNESGNLPIFSYEHVKAKSTDPAPGIDYMKREAYLSDEEFERVLEMTKEAFYAQPKWKRDMQKKKLDLF